jgi:hypothetical protein
MSYDLMVFEPTAAPKEREAFLAWYRIQTRWTEPRNYDDPEGTSERLLAWFHEMIHTYPPMNGPLRSENFDDPKISDYCIGSQVIYVAFRWSQASGAYSDVRRLAAIHRVGFFDVSGDSEIVLPVD